MNCPSENVRTAAMAALLLGLYGCDGGRIDTAGDGFTAREDVAVFEGPADRAICGPGANPEPALQGQVPLEVRNQGGYQEARNCNLELVGQFPGEGTSWQMAWYEDCAYYGTVFMGGNSAPNPNAGVQVIDASDTANPQRTGALVTPSMLDPWESLKVTEERGLLGAVAAWNIGGPLFFDVYDLKGDCSQPELLASVPMNLPGGHEGNWAPDGMTYYGSLARITAIDVSDPTLPVILGSLDESTHGLSISDDNSRAYTTGPACGNGMRIVDITALATGNLLPETPTVGEVCWEDGATGQHTIPVSYEGHPFVIFVDELGKGTVRVIDIAEETQPTVVSKAKLEIHMPENDAAFQEDCAESGIFCYDAHYCWVDRRVEPTALGCGYFNSGIRVFDIRDPYHLKEIAYYNPPSQLARAAELQGSEHANGLLAANLGMDLSADWCSAQIRFIPERGEIWGTCQDNGFMVLKFTNGVWPFSQ